MRAPDQVVEPIEHLVDVALARTRWRRTGPLRPISTLPVSKVWQIDIGGEVLWLKQMPKGLAVEIAVVEWLARLVPGTAPPPIARGPDWMITADIGRTGNRSDFASAVHRLAQVQIASIGLADTAYSCGCPDRRAGAMRRATHHLATVAAGVSLAVKRRLAAALGQIDPLWAALESSAMPATLVHGDLHCRNATPTAAGWVLFDWSDAAWSHPVFDLTMALRRQPHVRGSRIIAAFADAWSTLVAPDVIARAIALTPVLGPLYQAESNYRLAALSGDAMFLRDTERWILRAMAALAKQA